MKTISELKAEIEATTGMKVTVRKIKRGSMKGYIMLSAKTVNGELQKFDFDAVREFRGANYGDDENPTFVSFYSVEVFVGNQVFN